MGMIPATRRDGTTVLVNLDEAILVRLDPERGTVIVWTPGRDADGVDTVTEAPERLFRLAGLTWPCWRDQAGRRAWVNLLRVRRASTTKRGETALIYPSGVQILSEPFATVVAALLGRAA